jgi:hypothetical protein
MVDFMNLVWFFRKILVPSVDLMIDHFTDLCLFRQITYFLRLNIDQVNLVGLIYQVWMRL